MVVQSGVTIAISNPYKIANLLGISGINYFLSSETTLDIFYGIPYSVVSTARCKDSTIYWDRR